MKIIFTIPKLTYSGAPKIMAWIANQMAKRGHDVKFITYFSDEQGRELDSRIDFHWLGLTQSKSRLVRNSLEMITVLRRLDKYVRKENPDVLLSFSNAVGYWYLPLAKGHCNVIMSERADPYCYTGMLKKVRDKFIRHAAKVVFQTDGARDFYKNGKYGIYEMGTVIPNPVILSDGAQKLKKDIPEYEGRDNHIVTVGRLSVHQKRQDILIKAFDIVHKTHPELKLVIYGDGGDKNRIQALVDEMKLSDCVNLAGRISGVEKEILKARAFALTSDYEGVPNSLIEALSVGVPSVATDCSPGGAALLVKNNENGFLVPRGDIEAVAEGLLKIIENKEISDRFSKKGPEICDEFSEEKVADMWENAFKEFCGGIK